jgi:hypothetical protein
MGSVDVLRNKAEEYLEKARAISDRQRARLLLLQAHNYLKCAEETEAQQLSARRSPIAPVQKQSVVILRRPPHQVGLVGADRSAQR